MKNIDPHEFEKLYFQAPVHDFFACAALEAYADARDYRDEKIKEFSKTINPKFIPPVCIDVIANKYGTTVEEMKQHWKCLEYKRKLKK